MAYQFPEEGPAGGWGGAAGWSTFDRSPMNRGGLIYELPGQPVAGYGGGTGPPRSSPSPPPQLPPLSLSAGGGGGMAVPAAWSYSGGVPDAFAGEDPWMAERRKRFGGGVQFRGRDDGGGGWRPNLPATVPGGQVPAAGGNGYLPQPGGTTPGMSPIEWTTNPQTGDPYGYVSSLGTIYNLLSGRGLPGSMFDPTGNYAPYLEGLQGDLNRNAGAMLDRTRLRASLDPNLDPSQRNYASLVGEASAFGGAQDELSSARRGLAERNQGYIMQVLNQLLGLQVGGEANPFVDRNLMAKYQRMASGVGEGNWYDPYVQIGGQALGGWAGGGGRRGGYQ